MQLEDEFGDIVAKARKGIGLTVSQLARAAGLVEKDIEDIESYKFIPSSEIIANIAEHLSLDSYKLIEIANDAWIPNIPSLSRDKLHVKVIPVYIGNCGENCYIMVSAESGKAVIIDPGGSVDDIDKYLQENQLTLDLILITHAHGDHIGGLKQLAMQWPRARLANHQVERDSVIYGLSLIWEPAKDGVNIHFDNQYITPIFTPGHTTGSICYLVDGFCFVGDTIFAGSIGRSSGLSDYQPMLAGIRNKLLTLPDETILLPGHGPATTVGEEKEHNPFFSAL